MARRPGAITHAFGSDPIIVAYGVGVDSTAMLIGLRDRHVQPALILFADTGSEKPETIAYLPIMQAWLARNGMPPVTVIKRHSPRAGDTSLHGECLRKSVLPSLAYGGHSCSLKWKVDPQWRYTQQFFGWDRRKQSWPHGPTVTKLIGYDAGPRDSRRLANASGKWPPGHRYRYPLAEWGWTREHCEEGDLTRRPSRSRQIRLFHVSGIEKGRSRLARARTSRPRGGVDRDGAARPRARAHHDPRPRPSLVLVGIPRPRRSGERRPPLIWGTSRTGHVA